MEYLDTIIGLGIALTTFAVGYGKVLATIRGNKKELELRLDFLQQDVKKMEESNETYNQLLTDLNVNLTAIKKDVQYLVQNIQKIEQKVENL